MSIVEAWYQDLQDTLKSTGSLLVADVRVGVFYTAVQLDTGHAGVAFTPRDLRDTVCCPRSAAEAPPAGRMVGRNAWELAAFAFSPVPLRRAVGIATLNALSALAMDSYPPQDVRVIPGMDALEAAAVRPEDTVVLVGAFVPFIKALKGRVAALRIVDKHPEALKPNERPLWHPPDAAAEVLADAHVVIITGSTLVEGGLDGLLAAARQARRVVLAGPTASPWPPTFFARGIHVLGGLHVHNPEGLLRIVGEGGSGYFFSEVAEKVCYLKPEPTPHPY